jgi:carboxylesterase
MGTEELVQPARPKGGNDLDRPFHFFPPGPVRGHVLLVHGFTATPWEMRTLGEGLAEVGFSALGILLPGHGTTPEDLAKCDYRDWLAAVRDGYILLATDGLPIYGVGMSTGALLLACLATEKTFFGLVLLSPYLRLRHPLAPVAGWLSRWLPFQHRPLEGPGADHYYSRRPLAGVAQIHRLTRVVRRRLPRLAAPTLVLAAEGDRTIKLASGLDLFQRLGSRRKEYHRFGPNVPHVLSTPENPRWRQTLAMIADFISELEEERTLR